jgi:hypothetical protein
VIQISFQADVREAREFLKIVGQDACDRAAARALNDAARTLRAEGARAMKAKHRALRIGDIKRQMIMKQAFPRRLVARVSVKGRPLSLTLFRPHELKRGGVKVTLGNQRVTLRYQGRKTFRVKKYGNEIFARRHAKGRAIRRIRGPSLPGVFRARENEFINIAHRRFRRAFPSRMQYEIDRAAKVARARAGAPTSSAITGFVERQFGLRPGSL